MEGHHRLAMPLLPIAFTLIAIALLLSGEYNRRGQLLRILVAVAVVVAMEAALLGLKNMGERAPWVTPFMYLISIVPAAIAVYFIAPWRLRYRTVRNYIVGDRGRIPS
jgi:lipopolysaccharide export system permease protein